MICRLEKIGAHCRLVCDANSSRGAAARLPLTSSAWAGELGLKEEYIRLVRSPYPVVLAEQASVEAHIPPEHLFDR